MCVCKWHVHVIYILYAIILYVLCTRIWWRLIHYQWSQSNHWHTAGNDSLVFSMFFLGLILSDFLLLLLLLAVVIAVMVVEALQWSCSCCFINWSFSFQWLKLSKLNHVSVCWPVHLRKYELLQFDIQNSSNFVTRKLWIIIRALCVPFSVMIFRSDSMMCTFILQGNSWTINTFVEQVLAHWFNETKVFWVQASCFHKFWHDMWSLSHNLYRIDVNEELIYLFLLFKYWQWATVLYGTRVCIRCIKCRSVMFCVCVCMLVSCSWINLCVSVCVCVMRFLYSFKFITATAIQS